MKTTINLLLASLVILAGQAYAETGAQLPLPHDPGINKRQHNQQHRVKQGVRSGQLTKEERIALRNQKMVIRQEERAYKADGQLSKDERKDLHQDMNNLSKDINQQKHDAEVRPKLVK